MKRIVLLLLLLAALSATAQKLYKMPNEKALWPLTVEQLQTKVEAGDPAAMKMLAHYYLNGAPNLVVDSVRGLELLKRSSELGYEPSTLLLSGWYLDGRYLPKDTNKVYEMRKQLADKGNAAALAKLGACYELGYGVKKDTAMALSLYKKAYDTGDPLAVCSWAICLAEGLGDCAKDVQKAAQLMEQSYDQGYLQAGMSLVQFYANNEQYAQSLEWIEKIRWSCCKRLALYESTYYLNGWGCEQNVAKAESILLESQRRDPGEPSGAELLANIYLSQNDVAQAEKAYLKMAQMGHKEVYSTLCQLYVDRGDLASALRMADVAIKDGYTSGYYWKAIVCSMFDTKQFLGNLAKGAKLKDIPCLLTLGDVYRKGDNGVKINVKKALAYYEKAGALGSGRAYWRIGNMYLEGQVEGLTQGAVYKGIEYYNKSIDLGYDDALYTLGQLYESDYYGMVDYTKSLDCYTRLAAAGDPRGDFKRGIFYELGDGGLPQDSVKAIECYQKAADAGYNMAKCYLADFYKLGRYLPLDEKKAFDLYLEAAEEGSAEGAYYTGKCYLNGTGVAIDTVVAIKEYLRPAAQAGLGRACAYMGDFYLKGLGVARDPDSAVHYYYMGSKDDDTTCDYQMGEFLSEMGRYDQAVNYYLSAGKHGHGQSIVELALLLQSGKGVPQDMEQAHRLFHVATTYGVSDAYVELGVATVNGYGCEVDPVLAKSYFDTAVTMGNTAGMYDLAMCYKNGVGCEEDTALLVQWLERAAERDHQGSINLLGDYYEAGTYVEQSFEKAFEYYQRGVELGSWNSMCNLGYCYEKGQGCVLNSQKAYELYLRAAEEGSARGMYSVGNCYVEGIYVEENMKKAVEWMEKAAEAGHYLAQYNLGIVYENGEEGIAPDKKKAMAYYTMAAEQGFEPAIAALEKMKKKK